MRRLSGYYGARMPVVELTTSIEDIAKMVKGGHAVLVKFGEGFIITKQDIITAMSCLYSYYVTWGLWIKRTKPPN